MTHIAPYIPRFVMGRSTFGVEFGSKMRRILNSSFHLTNVVLELKVFVQARPCRWEPGSVLPSPCMVAPTGSKTHTT